MVAAGSPKYRVDLGASPEPRAAMASVQAVEPQGSGPRAQFGAACQRYRVASDMTSSSESGGIDPSDTEHEGVKEAKIKEEEAKKQAPMAIAKKI